MSYYIGRPNSEVVREADYYTQGPGFEYRVRHGCQSVRLRPYQWLRSKIGRRELPGSFFVLTCRPSSSKFSMLVSETRINTD